MGVFEDFAAGQARIHARWDFCECGFRVRKGDPIPAHFNWTMGAITPEIAEEMAYCTDTKLGMGSIIRPVPADLKHRVCRL